MAMTREEYTAWDYLIHELRNGYKEYADILSYLHLNLTDDPNVTAYLEPAKGTITVNRGFDADQVLVVIRHEIMHKWLEHEMRLIKHVASLFDLDPEALSDMDIDAIKKYIYSSSIFNIAADYEISNLTYGDYEKNVVRNLILNGETIKGLVTEDQHPDWVDLSVEEMFDKLHEEAKKNSMTRTGELVDDTTFVDEEGNVYGID